MQRKPVCTERRMRHRETKPRDRENADNVAVPASSSCLGPVSRILKDRNEQKKSTKYLRAIVQLCKL